MWNSIVSLRNRGRHFLDFMDEYSSGRKIVFFCLLFGLATCAVFWLVTFRTLDSNRSASVARAQASANTAAAAGAKSFANAIIMIGDAIVQLRSGMSDSGARDIASVGIQVFPIPGLSSVEVIDEKGALYYSSSTASSTMRPVSASEIEKILQRDELSIWPATAAPDGPPRLMFARPFWNRVTGMRGVVSLSVTPDFFANIAINGNSGHADWLAIVDEEGKVLVASPTLLNHATQFKLSDFSSSARLLTQQNFADARPRYVASAPINGYPLIALIGVDYATASEDAAAMRAQTIHMTLVGTAAAVGVTMLFMGFLLTLAWRKREVSATQETYRMATEGSNEGFFIVEVIERADNTVEDFMVIDCNRAGAAFCNKSRDRLVGQRFSHLYGTRNFERINEILSRAYQDSSLEEEVQFFGPGPMVRWMFVRAIRSNNRLAVTLRDVSDTKAHLDELEYKGTHDALTGLPNRHWLLNYLPAALDLAAQGERSVALLFIDLDGFKIANDTMGHAAGDELLQHVAHRLKEAIRPHDHVIRLGGDEFVVILESNVNRDGAAAIAERIIAGFRTAFSLTKGAHTLGASIGITLFPTDGADATTLLQNADVAMYAVKTSDAKGQYRFFEIRLYEELRSKAEFEKSFGVALAMEQFDVVYQPRMDIANPRPAGMEALVRWIHPVQGSLSPALFIGLAEENGSIIQLGLLVLRKVCTQLKAWRAAGERLVPVSINVSPRQFRDPGFAEQFCAVIFEHGIPFNLIEIELTESAMMDKGGQIRQGLNMLRAHGIKLIIDDFGTGYSSLAQLQEYAFDVLKVDKAFTDRLDCAESAKILFAAIIAMAHGLGMSVVAEGVEDAAQLEVLMRMRCDEAQGYLLSRPMPAADVQETMFVGCVDNFTAACNRLAKSA